MYEESLPREMENEIGRAPIAYLPWGAHEWHGAHNPIGLDGLKARFLAEGLCKELGGVVFPTVYCGHSTVKATLGPKFPLGLEFSADTVASLARDYLDQIASAGFRAIVIILGHWGASQGDIIRREVDAFNARADGTIAWAVQEDEMLVGEGYPDDHGAVEETSFVMAYMPGRVDLSRLPSDRDVDFAEDGVLGEDPRRGASAERGARRLRSYVAAAAPRIRDMLSSLEDR